MKSSNAKSTQVIELTETHNLALSLRRLESGAPNYDSQRWKRALYHALGMTSVASDAELEKIRIALELP